MNTSMSHLTPQVGADLVAGSLIKNPGGTLAPSGGYVAGRADLVAAAGRRLAAPGVAGGATLGMNRVLFQGLFHAPQVVGEALKGACLVAHVMGGLGYECNPPAQAGAAQRTDIIQAVKLGEREKVLAFCAAVQRCSPVGAHIVPVAGVTPGYGDEVVFADGTFVDGSTLELSAGDHQLDLTRRGLAGLT
jgi:cystathionine beta-lyase family protein involved in aluminum resistance